MLSNHDRLERDRPPHYRRAAGYRAALAVFRRAAARRPALAGLALCLCASSPYAQAPAAPEPAVVVHTIEAQPAANPMEFLAQVEAIEMVDVRAQVQGLLSRVAFEAGQSVQQGELLFEIEPGQYQAGVASAEAQLAQTEAARQEAARTLSRNQQLARQQSVPQAALDEARSTLEMAEANVKAAQAGLRSAKLDLSYTRIEAPIKGRIGRALFTRGNLVGPSSGPLAHIVQLDPIRVVFSVAEGMIVTLRQQANSGGGIDVDALSLRLRLPNGTYYRHMGRLDYVASEAKPDTGTVAVRVTFPNPERLLIPGQSVTLIAQEKNVPRLPVVPQAAVLQDREGRFVYVLDNDDTVSQRRIETGARVGNGWAVTQGLSAGEQVVVAGVQRLGNGVRVQPSEEQPDNPP